MSIFAELADGRRLEFPDDTRPEVIDAVVKREVAAKQSGPSVMDSRDPAAIEAAKESRRQMLGNRLPMAGVFPFGASTPDVARGAMDIPFGISQLVTGAIKSLSPKGSALDSVAPDLFNISENARKATDKGYNEAYRPQDWPGSSFGRGAGQALAIGPALAYSPAGGLLGRMAQGAAAGGAAAGLTPIDEPGKDFWSQKAFQTAGGALLGGLSVPIVEKVTAVAPKVINSVVDFWKGRPVRAVSPQDVQRTVTEALKTNGVDPAQVPQDAMKNLVEQAQQAMSAGRPLNAEAAARAADFASLGMQPLAGQISRDPAQFAFEQNIAGVKDIGEKVAATLDNQNRQLIQKTGAIAPAVGDKYAASENIIAELAKQNAQAQAGVRQAYDTARNTVGAGVEVPLQPLAQTAGNVVETFGTENIPGSVLAKLRGYGLFGENQTKSFTVEEADRLRKIINANMNKQNPPQYAALGQLLKGIDDSVGLLSESGATIGPEAAQAFKTAVGTAKQRFQMLEKVPALQEVADGGALPDKFFDRYIIRGNVTETQALRELLQANPAVIGDVRGQLIQHLQSAATNSKPLEYAQFSAAAYNKALNDIGERKLALFFSPHEVNQLKSIGRVAMARNAPPTGSPVNYSKSGSAVLDFVNRMGILNKVPGVGAVIGSIENAAQRGMVNDAVNPSLAQVISNPLPRYIDDATAEAIQRRLGIAGGGLLGLGFAGAANQ